MCRSSVESAMVLCLLLLIVKFEELSFKMSCGEADVYASWSRLFVSEPSPKPLETWSYQNSFAAQKPPCPSPTKATPTRLIAIPIIIVIFYLISVFGSAPWLPAPSLNPLPSSFVLDYLPPGSHQILICGLTKNTKA